MDIAKTFNATVCEEKWYAHWMEKGYFYSQPDDREPFTIVIPPPNVTGVLHMGHMLNNTLQDVLIRKARMQGFNTCWVPGTDHASIATEAKVVKKLADEGIKKSDLTRHDFLKHAWEWKENHGGLILEQLKKLGASCDWNRTKFTMDEALSESVIKVFVDLYNKGLIYRGVRMVNWDSKALTAVSDEEVIHKEVNSKLYYINYSIDGSDEMLTIATTRPETILGDTAICVNPKDERYSHLNGKFALVPLIDRKIPIIFDEYVDMEFGTGALKVTPAHDINDYQLGDKHNLEIIDILNDDGTLNESAKLYVGQDRFQVRENIVTDLAKNKFLVKTEDLVNKVGFSERTNTVIEPKLSMQWFLKTDGLSKPALEKVMDDTIQFHPSKFKNTYRHWMENIKDWCISRQLWWGQQIPAYFFDGNQFVVAETKELALKKAQSINPNITLSDLRQDEDVLDTWFSSWLWPISVFDGIRKPDNEEINYYYPTNDLVTGPDILFFWVARMIMAGYEYQNEMPFKNVYLTGIVRDKQGRKMSKSLGNSPDPLELIEKYGADGVRVGMLLSSAAGNDLLFDESLCEQGRNFSNKIWNATRLVKGWPVQEKEQPAASKVAIQWFEHTFHKTLEAINQSFEKYRISEALMLTYRLVWDDFCSWYLESVKPDYQQPIDAETYQSTLNFLDDLLKLLHPFMPFLTEEVWHLTRERKEDLMISSWPQFTTYNQSILDDFEYASEIITAIRTMRKEKQIAHKESLKLVVKVNHETTTTMDPLISRLVNLSELTYATQPLEGAFSFRVKSNEFFVPINDHLDVEAELEKLQSELSYIRGFLKSVEGKLSNQRFVNNAPENVVAVERKKQSDALSKIAILELQIKSLS